jgi:hypothetical protein
MGAVLTVLNTQTLHLPFSSAHGYRWIVTRRGQPFSVAATRRDFARAMYSAPLT